MEPKVHLVDTVFDWMNSLDIYMPGGGGFSRWHGIRICACLLGHFFAKFGIAIRGFSSETKKPKLHKLGVFWANYCKKHPIWSKFCAFLSKMVYWWVGNLAKNWYRDSQIFAVRQAHPRTILVKEPPPRVYMERVVTHSVQVQPTVLERVGLKRSEKG